MRRTTAIGLVCLGACGPTPPPEPGVCRAVQIEASLPAAGATDAFVHTWVRVQPQLLDPSTTLYLTERDGRVVPGAAWQEGGALWFDAADGLQVDTEYAATVSADCGSTTVPFRTGWMGQPLEADPTGQVYKLVLEGANWMEPALILDAIEGVFGGVHVLVRPTLTPGDLHLTVATGEEGDQTGEIVQDCRFDTQELVLDPFVDPSFEARSEAFRVYVGGLEMVLEDLHFTGAFSATGDRLQGQFRAMVDIRRLVPLIKEASDGDTACGVAERYRQTCVPCPQSGEPYCLTAVVEDIDGQLLSDVSVVDVTAGQGCP